MQLPIEKVSPISGPTKSNSSNPTRMIKNIIFSMRHLFLYLSIDGTPRGSHAEILILLEDLKEEMLFEFNVESIGLPMGNSRTVD
jgi:hypothetical protein